MLADLVVHSYILATVQCVYVIRLLLHNQCTFTAVECSALPSIPNGAITYGPDTIADFDVGTMATHTCNDGFVLVGSETRECLVGGRWSGLFAPTCRGT